MSRRVVGRPLRTVHRLLRSPAHAERLVRGRRTRIRSVAVGVQREEDAVRFGNVWNKLLGQRCHESLVAVDAFMSLDLGHTLDQASRCCSGNRTLGSGVTVTGLGYCAN